jgi:hypothetical protein
VRHGAHPDVVNKRQASKWRRGCRRKAVRAASVSVSRIKLTKKVCHPAIAPYDEKLAELGVRIHCG